MFRIGGCMKLQSGNVPCLLSFSITCGTAATKAGPPSAFLEITAQ
jgi:hypothetical protein